LLQKRMLVKEGKVRQAQKNTGDEVCLRLPNQNEH